MRVGFAGCGKLPERRDELQGLHANTHVPKIIGAERNPETHCNKGTILQAAEKLIRAVGRGFIPGKKANQINVGFSPSVSTCSLKKLSRFSEGVRMAMWATHSRDNHCFQA